MTSPGKLPRTKPKLTCSSLRDLLHQNKRKCDVVTPPPPKKRLVQAKITTGTEVWPTPLNPLDQDKTAGIQNAVHCPAQEEKKFVLPSSRKSGANKSTVSVPVLPRLVSDSSVSPAKPLGIFFSFSLLISLAQYKQKKYPTQGMAQKSKMGIQMIEVLDSSEEGLKSQEDPLVYDLTDLGNDRSDDRNDSYGKKDRDTTRDRDIERKDNRAVALNKKSCVDVEDDRISSAESSEDDMRNLPVDNTDRNNKFVVHKTVYNYDRTEVDSESGYSETKQRSAFEDDGIYRDFYLTEEGEEPAVKVRVRMLHLFVTTV